MQRQKIVYYQVSNSYFPDLLSCVAIVVPVNAFERPTLIANVENVALTFRTVRTFNNHGGFCSQLPITCKLD
jgi:hypothetical protein